MISIIEQFSCGKKSAESNEDKIVVVEKFAAVLDGVTSKRCPLINGKSGGRFAVEIAEKVISSFAEDINAREAVDALSSELKRETLKYLIETGEFESPSFVAAIYSQFKREIWLVGDISLMVDGKLLPTMEKKIDEVTSTARALVINIEIAKGASADDIIEHDVGREFIMPLLNEAHWLANNLNSKYGYGVINGTRVPDKFIEVFDVSKSREVVMASDGYPLVFKTLQETENYLADDLAKDKLRIGKHKGTKAVFAGNCSFDDRSYIRIKQ